MAPVVPSSSRDGGVLILIPSVVWRESVHGQSLIAGRNTPLRNGELVSEAGSPGSAEVVVGSGGGGVVKLGRHDEIIIKRIINKVLKRSSVGVADGGW